MKLKSLVVAGALLWATAASHASVIDLSSGSASFSGKVNCNEFLQTFTFELDGPVAEFEAEIFTTKTRKLDIDFSRILLTGGDLLSPLRFARDAGDPYEAWSLTAFDLGAGVYTLTLKGKMKGHGTASYNGTLNVTAVPEPATGAFALAMAGGLWWLRRRAMPASASASSQQLAS